MIVMYYLPLWNAKPTVAHLEWLCSRSQTRYSLLTYEVHLVEGGKRRTVPGRLSTAENLKSLLFEVHNLEVFNVK